MIPARPHKVEMGRYQFFPNRYDIDILTENIADIDNIGGIFIFSISPIFTSRRLLKAYKLTKATISTSL